MAAADYYLCDVCGGKCFYDANLSYDYDVHNPITGMPKLGYMGDMAAICDNCATTHEIVVREKSEAQTAPVEPQAQEPVAWMHDKEGRVDVIHNEVKKLWLKIGQPNGFYREKVPCKVEHYTIPLYAAPVSAVSSVSAVNVPEVPLYFMEGVENGGYYLASDVHRALALSAAPSAPAAPSDAKEPDWKRFALAVLIDARDNLGSDVDGGMVQDVATECGLLVKVEAQEPCDENCVCAEVGFPTDCYRYSKGTLRAIAATTQQKESGND